MSFFWEGNHINKSGYNHINTLPETNMTPENRPYQKEPVFQPSTFRCELLVSGRVNRECKQKKHLACFHPHQALKLLHSEARREPHRYDLVRKAVSTWLWMSWSRCDCGRKLPNKNGWCRFKSIWMLPKNGWCWFKSIWMLPKNGETWSDFAEKNGWCWKENLWKHAKKWTTRLWVL